MSLEGALGTQFYRDVYQMDKRLFAFLLLLGVLILAQIFMVERFADCSGSDSSGSLANRGITLSLSEVMTLLSSKKPVVTPRKGPVPVPTAPAQPVPSGDMLYDATGDIYYSSLKGDILDEIKSSVHDEVAANRTLLFGGAADSSSSSSNSGSGCGCESFATMQGSGFIKQKGVEYVRTDSIPCYGCSLK